LAGALTEKYISKDVKKNSLKVLLQGAVDILK
jgi:hypothetical protein